MRDDVELMWQAMKGSHYKRVVNQLADTIHGTEDFHKAISAALETVIRAVHAQTGTLWLYDSFATGRIYPKAVFGGADLSGLSLAPGEGIAGQVVDSGSAVIIEDCQKDKRWANRVDDQTGFQTRTMICVPLSWKQQTFGCIQIINQQNNVLFDEKDLSLAQSLAGEVSTLLHDEGLLREYLAPEIAVQEKQVSFQSLFCQGDERELERRLRDIGKFNSLTGREQQAVLRLCRKLRKYFAG